MLLLDRLKKQAKLYLRWHRDGYYPVAVLIRSGLARFATLSDRDILAAPFQLHDAQELVARRYGFESWPALTQGIDLMTDAQRARLDAATLMSAEPQLLVSSVNASAAYFVEKIGFAIRFIYGEPAYYAQIIRDGVCINLRHVALPIFAPDLREREADLLAASITVDDIAPLFAELEERGAIIHQRPRSEPWGARTFIVADPDGNLILFASNGEG